MLFEDLKLNEAILKALQKEGYTQPTPVQELAIPHALEGKDILACAQTGTGKTAAFSLPVLEMIYKLGKPPKGRRPIKALILSPTRELALQISDSLTAYSRFLPLRHTTIFGGVPQRRQTDALRRGVDIVVATPGRLFDLMDQGFINLDHISFLVLDEADRMLDMGFIHDVKKIVSKIPEQHQTLFFSATMPPAVSKLAETLLKNPEQVDVSPTTTVAETVEQSVFLVRQADKVDLLCHILENEDVETSLIFTRTKYKADKLTQILNRKGIPTEAIHGDKTQNARQRALKNFKRRKTRVLVATDVAARGIDIDELSHVINFEIPNEPESYVHRIGRTGRAGSSGIAFSFCDGEEKGYMKAILSLIQQPLPVVDHPYSPENQPFELPVPTKPVKAQPFNKGKKRNGNSGGNFRSRKRGKGGRPHQQRRKKHSMK